MRRSQLAQTLSTRKKDNAQRVTGALDTLLATLPLVRAMLQVQPLTIVAKHVLHVMIALGATLQSAWRRRCRVAH